MGRDQHVDQGVVENALGVREGEVDALPVEGVSPLDLAVQTIEEIVLFEPDSHLVASVHDDVGDENPGKPTNALGISQPAHGS